MRSIDLIVAILTIVIAPIAALADGNADEFKRANLLGHWAEDCSKPASLENSHVFLRLSDDGVVTETSIAGDDSPPLTIKAEFRRRLPNNHFEIRYYHYLEADLWLDSTIVLEPNRYRTIRDINSLGGENIRDGYRIEDGKPTAWFYRCDSKPSS